MIRALVISLALAGSAQAQSDAEAAAQNMGLAVDLCLQELVDKDGQREGLIPRFQAAGFTIYPSDGWAEVTAPGVFGYLTPGEAQSFCGIQSSLVPMAMAAQIAQDRVNFRYPGGAPVPAAPENRAGCPILRYTAAGQGLRMTILSAGNSGECADPNSSAILFGGF